MADLERRTQYGQATAANADIDQGLRSYMLSVYNYMALGLALTGLAAYFVFNFATTGDATQGVAQVREGLYLTQFGATVWTGPLNGSSCSHLSDWSSSCPSVFIK